MPFDSVVNTYEFKDLVSQEGGLKYVARWTAPAALGFFNGHFPGVPILPGAVTLEISLAFLRCCLNMPSWPMGRARHCKFKAPVTPAMTVQLEAAAIKPGIWQITWRGLAGDIIVQIELGGAL